MRQSPSARQNPSRFWSTEAMTRASTLRQNATPTSDCSDWHQNRDAGTAAARNCITNRLGHASPHRTREMLKPHPESDRPATTLPPLSPSPATDPPVCPCPRRPEKIGNRLDLLADVSRRPICSAQDVLSDIALRQTIANEPQSAAVCTSEKHVRLIVAPAQELRPQTPPD